MAKLNSFSTRRLDGPTRQVRRGTPRALSPGLGLTAPAVASPHLKPQRPRSVWRRRLRWGSIGLLTALALVMGFLGIKAILAAQRIITRNNDGSAPALAGAVDPTKLRGEGDGRINILLLGIGGPGHEGPYLSDTNMVVSFDPRTKDIAMLSIPRDLWVPIAGSGSAKINAADAYGEQKSKNGGGELAKQTFSKLLDIPIHYYIRVDFSGFKKAVDTVNGVDLAVDKPLIDPFYPRSEAGGFQKLIIAVGPQHMDGDLALKFARSRETTSDFDRAARQQKVLVALRQKALSLATLANPAKIAGLIDSVGNHVNTDLKVNELQKLARITKDIDPTKINQKVLDTSPDGLLVDGNIGGGYVELPRTGNFNEIREFVHSIFVDNYIKGEAATIEVSNATGRNGLATQIGATLKKYNYNVISTVTAPEPATTTVIYDYTGGKKPYTTSYLEKRFSAKTVKVARAATDPDIRILIGGNYKTN